MGQFKVKKRPNALQSFMKGLSAGASKSAPKIMEMMMKKSDAEKEQKKTFVSNFDKIISSIQNPETKAEAIRLKYQYLAGEIGLGEMLAYTQGLDASAFTDPEKGKERKTALDPKGNLRYIDNGELVFPDQPRKEERTFREWTPEIKEMLTPDWYTEPEQPFGRMAGATEVSEEQWNKMVNNLVIEKDRSDLRGKIQGERTARELTPDEITTLGLDANKKWTTSITGGITEKKERLIKNFPAKTKEILKIAGSEIKKADETINSSLSTPEQKTEAMGKKTNWVSKYVELGVMSKDDAERNFGIVLSDPEREKIEGF